MTVSQDQMPYYSPQLDGAELMTRVNAARVVAYNSFIEEKSASDFYFVSLLNYFLALAQYPLNFSVLNHEGKPLFHLCLDKQHRAAFTKYIENRFDGSKESRNLLFPLFPSVLNGSHFIAIFHMDTKNPKHPWTPIVFPASQEAGGKQDISPIETTSDYIAHCGKLFFSDPWYAFSTPFSEQARVEITNSLSELEKSYRTIPDFHSYHVPSATSWPNPNNGPAAWRGKLNTTLGNYIDDSYHGFRSATEMAQRNNIVSIDAEHLPPNILLAYRAFSRRHKNKNKMLRHYQSDTGGYSYDVQFLVPTASIISGQKSKDGHDIRRNGYRNFLCSLSTPARYEDADRRFYLYRNILMNGLEDLKYRFGDDFSRNAQRLVGLMDDEFWRLIGEGETGVDKLLNSLASPIGDHARSMVDPVFHTGLIHYNQIFQFGGLDRISHDKLNDVESFSQIHEEVQNDLRRIVTVYYLLSSAAAGVKRRRPESKPVNPRSLSVMLIPIKIRGSVWGVAIHAYYCGEEVDRQFLYHTKWLSNFLLATSGRAKTKNRVDQLLWLQAQNRVTNLLITGIGAVGDVKDERSRPMQFLREIAAVNALLEGEQMAAPFAFPQFTVHPDDASRVGANEVRQWLGDKDGERQYLRFRWTIKENEFFVPMQAWSQRATRGFREAVHLGVTAGCELMRAKLQK